MDTVADVHCERLLQRTRPCGLSLTARGHCEQRCLVDLNRLEKNEQDGTPRSVKGRNQDRPVVDLGFYIYRGVLL